VRARPACLVLALLAAGCRTPGPAPGPKVYDRPLPAGRQALRLVTDPAALPDLGAACADLRGLREALAGSLAYMAKPSSQRYFPSAGIEHARAVASLQALDAMLAGGLQGKALAAALGRFFDVYMSVGCDDAGTVLFTGYYTPILEASTRREGRFRHPIHRPPANLAKNADGEVLGLRAPDGTLRPCPPRAELQASGLLDGLELYWLADPFDAYIAHVQGSARLRLPDGKLVTAGYGAHNGHEYRSLGGELVKAGKLTAGELSLGRMREYFRAHPEDLVLLGRNPRYIFFLPGEGTPRGSLNEPVVALRTIAADKSIFPRASLVLVETELPMRVGGAVRPVPYRGLAFDQDAGGAIRAPGRCDVYMGEGDEAGLLAGQTMREGRLFYLFLKPGVKYP